MDGIGHDSGLTEDQQRAVAYHHKGHWQDALATKKTADANLKNTAKKALADGVSLDDIKLLIQLESPEGEAELRATLERQIKVAAWAHSDIGTQFSFLDEPNRTPVNERAFEEGKIAGMKGETCTSEPYEGAAGQERIRGWHEGQEALISGLALFKERHQEAEEQAAAARVAKQANGEDAPPKKRGRLKGSPNKNGGKSFSQQLAEASTH